jgi:hypothetical protein
MRIQLLRISLAITIVLTFSLTFVLPGAVSKAGELKNVPSRMTSAPSYVFEDVPADHPYYAYINMLKERGVTLGCNDARTLFCPDAYATRDEMAVFIERALGVFNPPNPLSQRFVDVDPNNFAYAFINDLAARGITVGCTPGVYCSGSYVTREQIAIFLERSMGRFNPPMPVAQHFLDVDSNRPSCPFVESFVDHTFSLGIMDIVKSSCDADGLHFCPDQPITRAELAAFLSMGFAWDESASAPSIESISPSSHMSGGGSFSVRINGSNLSNPSTISFTPPDGISVSIIRSLPGQIKATVTVAPLIKTAKRMVSVTTPGGPSNQVAFKVGF